MSSSTIPIGEDSTISIEDLADLAGDVAMEIYKTELKKGSSPVNSVKLAIEGATNVMLDYGCPTEVCDSLSNAAINGFKNYMAKNRNCDPMEAFDAAGDCVNEALDAVYVTKN
ncbi:MAG: hypothetical protein ACJ0G4_04390 [Alphaproteobacteria bacterium]